jgi:hydrogenase-4 component E
MPDFLLNTSLVLQRPGGLGGNVLDLLSLVLLGTAVLIVATPSPRRAVTWLVLQSVALAGIALVVALVTGTPEMLASVVITLAVKAVIVPLVLRQVLRRAGIDDDAAMYFGPRLATICALGLIVLAYGLVGTASLQGAPVTGSYFSTSVALILVGGLTMVVRKKALVQVIGLIVVENGVYVAAMATTRGLPPVMELGIAFDLLITIVLLGFLAFHIGVAAETLDTSTLRRLRG